MSLANRPLPWWLGPVLLGVFAGDIVLGVIIHRPVPTLVLVLSLLLPTWIALDFFGSAGKRRLQDLVQSAEVFTVAFDRATAARLNALGEGTLAHERALLVAAPAALEFWDEKSHPKRALVIAWEGLAAATVESSVARGHMVALQFPEAGPLVLDVVRPLHERLRDRAATAAEVAAQIEARIPAAQTSG